MEDIFRIYSGSLLRHSVAVTVNCYPPSRCDLASCRPTLPCAIRLPTLDVSQRRRRKQMSIHIGCTSLFWGNACWRDANLNVRRVFQRTTFFTGAIRSRDAVTNKITLLHPPLFFGSFILICVNTDIDVLLRGMRMCWACTSSALRPLSSALSFLPFMCCHYARPGESRTYTTTPIIPNCYNGSSSDRFYWKQQKYHFWTSKKIKYDFSKERGQGSCWIIMIMSNQWNPPALLLLRLFELTALSWPDNSSSSSSPHCPPSLSTVSAASSSSSDSSKSLL